MTKLGITLMIVGLSMAVYTAAYAAPAGCVDVNKASAAQLAKGLKGVGPVKAARIVAVRSKGRFRSLKGFQKRVKGIGPKTVSKNAKRICRL